MRDSDHDDQDIDRAYRAALAATGDDAAAERRRRAVLQAVAALDREPAARPGSSEALPDAGAQGDKRAASNSPWWNPSSTWWRGAAAACVIASTALLVTHWRDEPGAGLDAAPESTARSTAEQDAQDAPPEKPAPPAVAGTTTPAPAPQVLPAAPPPPLPAAPAAAPTKARQSVDAHQQRASGRPDAADAAAPAGALAERQRGRKPEVRNEMAEHSAAAPTQANAAPPAAMNAARPASQPLAKELLTASRSGDVEAARRLLESVGPDEATDGDGRTALTLAVLRSNLGLVKLLIGKGANKLARDRFRKTPLDYADASGDPDLFRALTKEEK